jgi:glutamyl-tRNA synthetase
VRTALFNYLFARRSGGKFLLRVEDTDKKRSTQEAIQVILDGLAWLGMNSDEGVVYQSQQQSAHRKAGDKLLENGAAYRCFCTKEQIAERREIAQRKKNEYKYDRRCAHLSDAEIKVNLDANMPFAVRLKVPGELISFDDLVHERITVSGMEIEDFILLRSDGTPTYMLAVVVDDAEMRITHIIRGDDHISNTPKQILIYRALGLTPPKFVHVPVILGPDKRKLSKRHGAAAVNEYRDVGYLSDTLINYLGLLGWSPGDDRNEITPSELEALFDLKGIIAHSAVFDEAKLRWLNGLYIGKIDYEAVKDQLISFGAMAVESGLLDEAPAETEIKKAWDLLKNRIHTLKELFEWGDYFFQHPKTFDKKGVKKNFKDGAGDTLISVSKMVNEIDVFEAPIIEEVFRKKAEEDGLKASQLIHPTRLAVSGRTGGPSLFELLETLGREVVVQRTMFAGEAINNGNIEITN